MITSDKKIESNRRNALKSTCPRTVKGKSKSRWNAIKHGLLAKEVVVPVGTLAEDHGEFDNLLDELVRSLWPQARWKKWP